jgi:hypothetical protein
MNNGLNMLKKLFHKISEQYAIVILNTVVDNDISVFNSRLHWYEKKDLTYFKPTLENVLNQYNLIFHEFEYDYSLNTITAIFNQQLAETDLENNYILTKDGFIPLTEYIDIHDIKIYSCEKLKKYGYNIYSFNRCVIRKSLNWLFKHNHYIIYKHVIRSPLNDPRPSLFATKNVNLILLLKVLINYLSMRIIYVNEY